MMWVLTRIIFAEVILWVSKSYIFNKQNYRNDPKFLDRFDWANTADPDQTAPLGAVGSVSSLFAIPFTSF